MDITPPGLKGVGGGSIVKLVEGHIFTCWKSSARYSVRAKANIDISPQFSIYGFVVPHLIHCIYCQIVSFCTTKRQ